MTIVKSPFFTEMTGRYGNFIFYRVKNQIRMRHCPDKVKNVNSEAQQLQRGRMRAAIAFYRTNQDTLLSVVWKELARCMIMSGYNLFIKKDISVFDQKSRIADYEALRVSDGYLELPLELSVSVLTEKQIEIRWKKPLTEKSLRDNDRLWVAWLPDNGSFALRMTDSSVFCRQDLSAVVQIPELSYQNLHIYCFFADKDRKRFSPSSYFYLKHTGAPDMH